MFDLQYSCCFTGHRPGRLSFGYDEESDACIALKNLITRQIIHLYQTKDVRHFISGMSLGVDLWAAHAVLLLRSFYTRMTLECAIPCPEQSKNWSDDLRRRYEEIIRSADKVSTISPAYRPGCMQKRNQYMIDNARYLIAVYDGKSGGGTANTMQYALRKNRTIIHIDPGAV